MKHRVSILTFLLVIALLFGVNVASQTPSQSPDKPLYQPNGTEATILGTIGVNGPIPKARRIDMAADPVCIPLNDKPETESFITNGDRLVNVFVYVKSEVISAHRFQPPDSAVTMERRNCRYSPHVLGLRVGQTLSIANLDPTQHNTHPTPKLNQEWNQTQAAQQEPILKTFSREEVLIPFKCNHHPWEKAYVAVVDHPFFAVTDRLGNYEIRGVPAGTHTLAVWHEELGWQEVEISLSPNENRRADFTFDSNKKP
jgi:plastocyanin